MTSPLIGSSQREETVVINGESLPLMRDGRFPVYSYFPEGTKLYDATCMPPALVPLNGVKTWLLNNGAPDAADSDEDDEAERGVTVFRLIPFAPYIAVTAPLIADEVSKHAATGVALSCFESHEARLLASFPGRVVVETCEVVEPHVMMATPKTRNPHQPPQESLIPELATSKQLLQEDYSSYAGMNPDLSAFTPAMTVVETLEVFENMCDLSKRWKETTHREPQLSGFANLDDLSHLLPIIELPERANCHALKLLLCKAGRVAEHTITLSSGTMGPGNASAALYNCARGRELENNIRKLSFAQAQTGYDELGKLDNRTVAYRGAALAKAMDPYHSGLRLPALWKSPQGDCIIVPTHKTVVSLHEVPPAHHHHHRVHPQVRVGFGGSYERHGGSQNNINSSPTSPYPYSSSSSVSSPTGYSTNGHAPPHAQHYPSFGNSATHPPHNPHHTTAAGGGGGVGAAPGVNLPSRMRGMGASAVPSFRPGGTVRPNVSMSVGATPYVAGEYHHQHPQQVPPPIESPMSASAAPYQSTSSIASGGGSNPNTVASEVAKPLIPKPRSHQSSQQQQQPAPTAAPSAPVAISGAPMAVGSTPPLQPTAAPAGSVPPFRGSHMPTNRRH